MKNIFDPFGVFKEWKGQETDNPTWEETVAQDVVNAQLDAQLGVLSNAVYAGIDAERERIISILNKELSATEVQRIIRIIESGDE